MGILAQFKNTSICLMVSCVLAPISSATLLNTLVNFPGHNPFLPVNAVPPNASSTLPIPLTLNPNSPNKLSIKQAVLLAMHKNPSLQVAVNNRRLQRYDLAVAEQEFRPQFNLATSMNYSRYQTANTVEQNGNVVTSQSTSSSSQTTSASVGPNVSWKLPLGTQISANWQYNPSKQSGSITGVDNTTNANTWTVTLTQPLLKNFGFDVNEVSLENAKTTQKIDDLQLAEQVESTVASTVTDYYAVVQAKQAMNIAKQSLENSKRTLFIREEKYKAGQIAGIDVDQARMDISTQEQSLQTAEQAYNTTRTTLMDDLGLPDNTVFTVDENIDIAKLDANIADSLAMAKSNNRDLKIALLQHDIAQRNMLTSENAQRWQLDLQLSKSRAYSSVIYNDPQISPNSNNIVDNTSVSLNLTIPLNRTTIDQEKLSTAIALENDQINLRNSRTSLMNNVRTAVQNLNSQWSQVQNSLSSLKLSEKNYRAAEIKFSYGRLDAFSLSQQQQQYIQAKNAVVSAKIAYLTQVINYEKLVGTLLDKWHIKLEAKNHA